MRKRTIHYRDYQEIMFCSSARLLSKCIYDEFLPLYLFHFSTSIWENTVSAEKFFVGYTEWKGRPDKTCPFLVNCVRRVKFGNNSHLLRSETEFILLCFTSFYNKHSKHPFCISFVYRLSCMLTFVIMFSVAIEINNSFAI